MEKKVIKLKKGVEFELQKNIEIKRALLNATDQSAFLIDLDGNFLAMNSICAKLLNRNKKDLLGKCAYNFIPKDIVELRKKEIQKSIDTKKLVVLIDEREGMILENRIYPVLDLNGNVYQLAIYAKDITKEKKAERELKAAKDRLSNFINSVSAAIYFMDYDKPMSLSLTEPERYLWNRDNLRLTNCNDIWAIDRGYKNKEEIIGKKVFEIYSNSEEAFTLLFKNFDKNGYKIVNWELPQLTKDGELLVTISNSFPTIKDNKLYSIQGTSSDITENKKLQNQLEDTLYTKDKFFSILSHDIRTPLGSIVGFSDILYDKILEKGDKDLLKTVKVIKDTAEGTFRFFDNLLIWARAQKGIIEFKPKWYNLIKMVQEVADISILVASQKGIKIELKFMDDIDIFVDKDMIKTVLRNILSNGIKFTPKNGLISITTKTIDNLVVINIKDSGVGMSKEYINNLFNLNRDILNIGTDGEKGTGLGLILCKEFIDRHKGSIDVFSELGKGTTFSIKIPLKQ